MNRRKNNEKRDNQKFIYINDYDTNKTKIRNYENSKLMEILGSMYEKINNIEAVINSPSIIKATPIISLVSSDFQCLNKINHICQKWIRYISQVANNTQIDYDIPSLFWELDKFIFDNYFANLQNKKYRIIEFIDYETAVTQELEFIQKEILRMAVSKYRNKNLQLKDPSSKEYISHLIKDKHIFIVYFFKEIHQIINETANEEKIVKRDFHFTDGALHPSLSLNDSLIGKIDTDSIAVKMSEGDKPLIDMADLKDKRYNIMRHKRPLYNNLIDTACVNKLNSSLYRFNPLFLNLSFLIFHTMIHIKCSSQNDDDDNDNADDDDEKDHGTTFLKEIIQFLPSVFFGHRMLPALTMKN